MKSAQIKDILSTWIKHKGGSWEKLEGRPGERNEEFLIGELELEHTSKTFYNDILHYIISFNETVPQPLSDVFSSTNAERLTESEILNIIENPPVEEL